MNAATHHNGAPRGGTVTPLFPHNLAAEMSVLGAIIVRNEVLAELGDLETNDFYDFRNKVVFGAMRALEAQGKPIDSVTLEVEIDREGKLDAVGGIGYLGDLALRVPVAESAAMYAAEVRLLKRNRDVMTALRSAAERVGRGVYSPEDLIPETIGELQRIESDGAPERAKRRRWAIPLLDFLGGDVEPDDDDSEDWIIRDLVPRGEPFLWGGPMKGGKTWAALDLLITIAMGGTWLGKFENTMGKPVRVLGVFMEDSKRRLAKRVWELARAHGTTPNHPVLREHLMLSRAPLSLPDVNDQRRITAEIKASGAQVVVFDNLTRVMIGDPNNTKDAAMFTRAWTQIGEETGAATGFLHHTKKDNENAVDSSKERDPFNALRGSNDFGAAARNMIVTRPIRSGSMAKTSEVFMRGNIDLRRESFALSFERTMVQGKQQAVLADKGDVNDVRAAAAEERKIDKETKRRDDKIAEMTRRRDQAITMCRRDKFVSSAGLGMALGLSANAVLPVLRDLVGSNVLRPAGKHGYELLDATAQGDLSV